MRINKKDAIIHKLVFEARYRWGYTYLDKCGRTVNRIMRERPEWIPFGSDPNPQNAPLISTNNGSRFNFSALKYDIMLEQSTNQQNSLSRNDIEDFSVQIDYLASLVNDELNLNEFTRAGFRIWYLFGFDSIAESDAWISDLGKIKFNDSIAKDFCGEIESRNFTVVIAGEDRKYRISVNSVERTSSIPIGDNILNIRASKLHKNQKQYLLEQMKEKQKLSLFPMYAVMMDIDSYIENPKEIDGKEFILSSYDVIESKLANSLM